ncbi:hypothetical protein DH2020_023112 [Rehmannia glutinosa]|uniref:Membrane-associated kinase regulator-like protein n=1 Tax=Rehmannia glutinosa TaxID=99300 RepID=A0ABR0W6W4_REHGL
MEKENSQPLATESFSYSWLTDKKPSSSSSSDIHPNNLRPKQHSFNFDVPVITSSLDLVHADEIFSNGHIMPVYIDRSKFKKTSTSDISPNNHPFVRKRNEYNYSLGKLRKSSKRILQKCFGFVKPLKGSSRKSNRVDDLERKVIEVQSLSNSCEASPRPSSAYSVVDWADIEKNIAKSFDFYHGLKKVKSGKNSAQASPNISPSCSTTSVWCDAENSIHEAILYCKRSIAASKALILGPPLALHEIIVAINVAEKPGRFIRC